MSKFFLIANIILYLGFVFSAQFYFKKINSNKEQSIIKIFGLINMLLILYFTYESSIQLNIFSATIFVVNFYAIVLFYWTAWTVRKIKLNFAFSESQPKEIVTSGSYAFIRHPFYGSYILAWITGISLTQNIFIFFLSSCLIFLYFKASSKEEREFLSGDLNEQYKAYKNKTSRFIFPIM